MSNKLCLYERGNVTEPEMYNVWIKNSISNNFCQYSFVIAPVCFNIERITTQHTTKCVENCFDSEVSHNCPSNFSRFSVTSVITLKTAFFSQPWTNYFVMDRVCHVHRP